jgi:hypothetical protein
VVAEIEAHTCFTTALLLLLFTAAIYYCSTGRACEWGAGGGGDRGAHVRGGSGRAELRYTSQLALLLLLYYCDLLLRFTTAILGSGRAELMHTSQLGLLLLFTTAILLLLFSAVVWLRSGTP